MRRIKKARIQFVSLVPKGSNGIATIYKDDGTFDFGLLMKDAPSNFADRGELAAVVYAPERRDSQGDIASAEVIKDAMYEAAREGFDIDIRHDGKAVPREKAFVAETFIVQKNDPRFDGLKDYAGKPVDPTGSWGVIVKIDDQELRKLYREGKWSGVSMAGVAVVEHHKSDEDTGELDMKPEELEAALKKSNETLAASIADSVGKAVTAALKKEEPKPEEKGKDKKDDEKGVPVFKGEPTVENLRKHRQAVRKHTIISGIDWSDAESVEKGEKALAELEEEIAKAGKKDDEEGDDKGKTPEQREIARLEKEIADIRKRSNTSKGGKSKSKTTEGEDDGVDAETVGVEKEDADLMSEGLKAARQWNSKSGRGPATDSE